MKIKKLTMFLILSSLVFGNDIELENLEKLKEKNLITREDYLILKNEILGANEEIQYTLKVNGIEKDNFYPVIVKNDDIYLNLNVFFEINLNHVHSCAHNGRHLHHSHIRLDHISIQQD